MKKTYWVCLTVACVVVISLVAGRAGQPRQSQANIQPNQGQSTTIRPAQSTKHHSDAKPNDDTIKVAMSAAFVSKHGLPVYERIVEYMSKKLARDCELVDGFSYSAISSMLDAGTVDVGFVCGLPYVLKRDQQTPTVVLLAAPVMKDVRYKGAPKYSSHVIVHKNSHYANFTELKGCTYVYNDELSNSGYNMPRARMIELGFVSGFFGKLKRSGSHEESIRMVATGEADASSVDSLVLEFDLAGMETYAQQVKIIETLGPAGIPPVVASTKLSSVMQKRIQNVLLGMKDDPVGRQILDDALIASFEAVDDSNYDDIRHMMKMAENSEFTKIK